MKYRVKTLLTKNQVLVIIKVLELGKRDYDIKEDMLLSKDNIVFVNRGGVIRSTPNFRKGDLKSFDDMSFEEFLMNILDTETEEDIVLNGHVIEFNNRSLICGDLVIPYRDIDELFEEIIKYRQDGLSKKMQTSVKLSEEYKSDINLVKAAIELAKTRPQNKDNKWLFRDYNEFTYMVTCKSYDLVIDSNSQLHAVSLLDDNHVELTFTDFMENLMRPGLDPLVFCGHTVRVHDDYIKVGCQHIHNETLDEIGNRIDRIRKDLT